MSESLYHHGIKGMKWGIRRFQNPDGSLTEAGKRRQYKQDTRQFKRELKKAKKSGQLYGNVTNRKAVMDKAINESLSSKESKEFKDYERDLADFIDATAKENGIKPSQIRLGKDDPLGAKYFELQNAAIARGKQIGDKYLDEVAKATLSDIQASDTAAARDLIKQMLIDDGYYLYF